MRVAKWTETACEDLASKVRTQAVRDELREVARKSLDDPPGEYGGSGRSPLLWRRGVTAETRLALEAAERDHRTLDDDKEHGWQFTLVYYMKRRSALPDLPVILGVLTQEEFLSDFGDL